MASLHLRTPPDILGSAMKGCVLKPRSGTHNNVPLHLATLLDFPPLHLQYGVHYYHLITSYLSKGTYVSSKER